MRLDYASPEVRKICIDERYAQRRLGTRMSRALTERMRELKRATHLAELLEVSGRWEPLRGNRRNQWSGHLTANWRLIVTELETDAGTVIILEIVDYH